MPTKFSHYYGRSLFHYDEQLLLYYCCAYYRILIMLFQYLKSIPLLVLVLEERQ